MLIVVRCLILATILNVLVVVAISGDFDHLAYIRGQMRNAPDVSPWRDIGFNGYI